jgi:hypothetical protein
MTGLPWPHIHRRGTTLLEEMLDKRDISVEHCERYK